jgi:UDP-glucose 4-epimerase
MVEHLSSQQTKNEVFNIGNSELVSVNEVALAILSTAHNLGFDVDTPWVPRKDLHNDKPVIVNWFDKACRRAGWSTRTPLARIIEEFIKRRYGDSEFKAMSN